MGLFDFIGSGPDQISLPEILSAIPAVAGPYLMARGRKIGGPLGIGLTAFGGLGEQLAQRQQQTAQRQGLAKMIGGMPGVTADQQKFLSQYVEAGGDPSSVVSEILKNQFKGPDKPVFSMQDGKEIAFDPAKGTKLYDVPGTTSSFQPKGKSTGLLASVGTQLKAMGVDPATATADQITAAENAISQRGVEARLAGGAPVLKQEETPEGRVTGNFWHYDAKKGRMVMVPTEDRPEGIPAKLDATSQKQVQAVENARIEFPILMDTIRQMPPTSPATLLSQYSKYKAPGGILGAVDPRYEAYFAQIGQLKGDLLGAASGARQSVPLMNYIKDHIPNETDPPARALGKMKSFEMGRFNALLKNTLGTGTPAGAAATAAANAGATPPQPPFEVDKTYNQDGQWYVKDKAGKFYQFDGSKWAPL